MVLRWTAAYADGREVSGTLPGELPGASVPREGLRSFALAQGSQDSGWTPILVIELADHERLVFRRRMVTAAFAEAVPVAVGLIGGIHNAHTGELSAALYLNGDGTMALRSATADVVAEPHEVG